MRPTFQIISKELDEKLNLKEVIKEFNKLDYIDFFNDQFSIIEKENPIPFPAILLEFSEIQWRTISKNIQKGLTRIRVHVGQQSLADTHTRSSDQEAALKVLDYLCEVHKVLQGFSGTNFTSLDRKITIPDTSHDNLIIHIMEYDTEITDASANDDAKKEEITGVTPEVEKQAVIPAKEIGAEFPLVETKEC